MAKKKEVNEKRGLNPDDFADQGEYLAAKRVQEGNGPAPEVAEEPVAEPEAEEKE